MTLNTTEVSIDRFCDEFTNFLYERFAEHRHVRRVASWIGVIVCGIEAVSPGLAWGSSPRQVRFDYGEHGYKLRYQHSIGGRGGFELLEVLPGRGAPDGDVLLEVDSLERAWQVFGQPGYLKAVLDARGAPGPVTAG